MQIVINAPGLQRNERLETAIEKKFQQLQKFYDRIVKCTISLKEDPDSARNKRKVEVKLSVPGKILFASEQTETFDNAIQQVYDVILRQLNRYKEATRDFYYY
jgi:putative sigma-54 modulation protein